MSEFHFLRPAWFLALIPALALLVLWWRRRGQATGWHRLVAPELLAHLLLDAGQGVRRLPVALLGLGWLLGVTALAGPTWERQPQPVYRAPADRVMVLDMSPSMAAGDLQPDRLTRARLAIRRLLSGTREGRTAVVVFAAEPHVVAPLTDDVATIEALLPALSVDIMPAPGDRAGPALRTAGVLLQRVGSRRGDVLLLSDGIEDPADSLEAIHALRRQGVRTSVLGVGTPDGAPLPAAEGGFATGQDGNVRLARLDEPGLTALARAGGGRYRRLGDGPPLLPERALERDPAHARAEGRGLERWVEQGPWLLLPLLLIAALGMRRGWLGLLMLVLIPPPPAHALSWQDLWLRPDQQASRLLEQGETRAAAERFRDSEWRATAAYRAGDYAAAAAGFAGDGPDSLYNRGNALARAGRLQEAIEAYAGVLERQPEYADARFNRDLMEQLLQQQQAQSGQSGQSGSGQDNPQGGTQAGSAQEDPQGGTEQAGSGRDDTQHGSSPSAGVNDPAADASDRTQHANASDNPANSGERAGEAANAGPTEQRRTQAADAGQSASAVDEHAEPAADRTAATEHPGEPPVAEPGDSAARARADVAPTAERATPGVRRDPAGQADAAAGGQFAAVHDNPQEPPGEQELALEQWLRQVPDDPAGLLRRKFMLEHLRRQQRQAP